MTKLLCNNPNDEVKYMTRVQSWSSLRLIDQFPCLTQVNTYKQTCAHVHVHTLHFNMHTNILLACPPPSPSSSKFSYKHNIITYQQKGEQSLETYSKNTDPSSITSEFNTSATLEKESPSLLTHPYHSIRGSLSEQCTRRVSHQ